LLTCQPTPRRQTDEVIELANADESWSRGILAEVATEVRRRCDWGSARVLAGMQGFMEMRRRSTVYRGTQMSRLSDVGGI
jgi:hypothetical protein